jgi:hypothetical protein
MAPAITPKFYWSEAERLLTMASKTIDREARVKLVQLALLYEQMAADLQMSKEQQALAT